MLIVIQSFGPIIIMHPYTCTCNRCDTFSLNLHMLYYIVRRASTPMAATSISQVMGRNEGSISSEGVVPSPMSPPIGLTSSGRFSSSTTVMILPESASLSDSEEVEEIEFNNQIGGEGCLPNSSYYEEDTLFTWEDITGSVHVGSVEEGWTPM